MKRRDFVKVLSAGGIGLSLPASLVGFPSSAGMNKSARAQVQQQTGSIGMDRQMEIYMAGRMQNQKPAYPVSPDQLETEASRKMSVEAYGYVAGGAGSERTMRFNRESFDKHRIRPRMLRNVKTRSLETRLFGYTLPAPILLAPIGVQSIIHDEAELATAKAAAALGLPMVCSTVSSRPLEEIGPVKKDAPNWFQLYWPDNEELAVSLVKRAEKAGFGAIVITLDTYLLAWRERDLQEAYLPFFYGEGLSNYFSDPVFQSLLGGSPADMPMEAVMLFGRLFSNASLTWDNLKTVKDATRLPVILKGILHPEDARLAVRHGMDGIIVSNHGGRQVDGSIAALDALGPVVDAVGPDFPVLFDSGIRRGADVFTALALGAKAVLPGRPYAYGLALNGSDGVRDVLHNLMADFDLTMGLAGCKNISEINREMIIV